MVFLPSTHTFLTYPKGKGEHDSMELTRSSLNPVFVVGIAFLSWMEYSESIAGLPKHYVNSFHCTLGRRTTKCSIASYLRKTTRQKGLHPVVRNLVTLPL